MKIFLNIFLVGMMGAGKTTIGRQLAKSLELEFLDSDQEIERITGTNIPWIFDIEGEPGFRKRECAVINELTQRQGIVLATGGGAVLDSKNRSKLSKRGTIVYLHATLDQILQRTAKDRTRPLLQTEDPKARLEALIKERDPIYRQIADIIVDTDNRSVRETVEFIVDKVKHSPAKKPARKKRRPKQKKRPVK